MKNCTQCGLCAQVCMVERLGGRSIASFLNGREQYSPWLCSSCWSCQEVCPESIDIHQLMLEKRREKEAPEGYRRSLRNILECGYSLPLNEEINQNRRSYGLGPVELIPQGWIKSLLREVALKRLKDEGQI